MRKNIILSIAKVSSYFWLFLQSKIRRFIFTGFLILESRDSNRLKSIKNLFLIKDKLDWIINERAIKYGNGIHPKHLITNYHQFFIDRIKEGESVLDVGCGNGTVAISIAKRYPKSLITGVDLDKKNIKFAKEKQKQNNLKNLNFINCDINECTEIKTDIVILSNVLEHIENRPLFLRNIQKLTGSNIFLIRVPYFKRDWQIAFRKEIGIYHFSDKDHKIEHTLEELKQELKISNFKMNETILIWGEIWTKCEYEI